MKKNNTVINNAAAYDATMARIDFLMKKGEQQLSTEEAAELSQLALAAESYEKSIYVIPAPKTLEGLIELKMFE
ncbi:MAG: hypothetical protein QM664_09500, partial [Flavihumibacter sp.]